MEKTLTVSQLNSYIKGVFDDELILQGINVSGEIFEFKVAGGNSYITLKDGDCILNCVFFSSAVEYAAGQQVQASGSVRFYQKSGKVSFIITHIKIVGRGEILLALEKTRERLGAEGVFSNKRELPALVTRVAFVTSEEGAVMHDFASVVGKIPYLCIVLFPVRVQGKGAADEIISIMSDISNGFLPESGAKTAESANYSLMNMEVKECTMSDIGNGFLSESGANLPKNTEKLQVDFSADNTDVDFEKSTKNAAFLKKFQSQTAVGSGNKCDSGAAEMDFDVIVIARGGGSTSDLSEFNNEALARAIHASKVPVISAVGHETDYTLSDFAADIRAGTPSIAAEIISANNAKFFERLANNIYYISAKTEQILEDRLRRIGAAMGKTDGQITGRIQRAVSKTIYDVSRNQTLLEGLLRNCDFKIKTQSAALSGILTAKIDAKGARLSVLNARTEQLNPQRILEKGYAKLSKNGKEISGISSLKAGDEVEFIMSDGSAVAAIERTKPNRD